MNRVWMDRLIGGHKHITVVGVTICKNYRIKINTTLTCWILFPAVSKSNSFFEINSVIKSN